MTILEKVKSTFLDCKMGKTFSWQEVVDMVVANYPYDDFSRRSIIPTDYCYNRLNKGKFDRPELLDFNIFEYDESSSFKYLGEHYPHNGKIYQRPRGTYADSDAGYWVNGKRFLL